MIRCIAFQGGAPFDLVQQQFLTAVGSGHFDTVRLGGLGHRHGASNGSMCYTFPVTTEARNSFSVAWHGEMHSGTTIGLRDTTVAGGTILLWRNSGFDQRVGGTDYSAGGTWNLDQPTRIVHTSGASAARLYADGNLIINGGAPGATALVSPWALHRNGSVSNAQGCVATDYLLALWDRPLEPDEAYEWMRDPYGALLRPVSVFVPRVVAGGSANLVIADATHGHTADGLGLTQAHQLAVQDASHAHAADSLALTQAHALAVADATHAHAADNVVLSVEAALAIADALHGHVADGVVLTQVHVLAVADALHAHAADGLTLDTATALQIADAVHGHLADSLGLTQAHVLAIAEALHAHTADQVTLADPLERQETRGGRGSRGLLPYEEPFSADDLQKLDELHEARRQAQQVEQPKPAKPAKRAGKKAVARAPARAKAAEPVEAKALERPAPAAVIDSVVLFAKREQDEAVNALAIQEAEEEEEFAMVLMQVLLAA